MTWDPLDGHMIAADAHFESKAAPQEGDRCGVNDCDGIIGFQRFENCSCHISPPCEGCVSAPLSCPKCYEVFE